jgi:hypothetical protein
VCQFGTEAASGELDVVEGEFAGEGVTAEAGNAGTGGKFSDIFPARDEERSVSPRFLQVSLEMETPRS